jgi:hypothetical protein
MASLVPFEVREKVLGELKFRGSATVAELAASLGVDSRQVVGTLLWEQDRRARKLKRFPLPKHPRQFVWVWGYIDRVPLGALYR